MPKGLLLAAALYLGATAVAGAQNYYPAYPYYGPPPTPPSWSYDPYTSGAAPCPQGLPDEQSKCATRMPPTYGQPSYWPVR